MRPITIYIFKNRRGGPNDAENSTEEADHAARRVPRRARIEAYARVRQRFDIGLILRRQRLLLIFCARSRADRGARCTTRPVPNAITPLQSC